VDGVYTADPRIVKTAKKLSEVSYDEMLELASLGANVLHNRSVEMAKKYNVELEVISSFNPIAGTIIKEVSDVERMLIRGVTRDNDVAQIAVIGIEDRPGIAFKLFSLLAKHKINVDIILQSVGRDNTKDISFTVTKAHLEGALKIIKENLSNLKAKDVSFDENISKVSIVGAGMASNPGVAAKMFEALSDIGVNIKMISTSEIKVSVLIEQKDAEKAVNAIHDKLLLA
jgi:aspartate kinase